jgi:hypothetical protein
MALNREQRRNAMPKTLMIVAVITCVLISPAASDNIAPAKRADIEKTGCNQANIELFYSSDEPVD